MSLRSLLSVLLLLTLCLCCRSKPGADESPGKGGASLAGAKGSGAGEGSGGSAAVAGEKGASQGVGSPAGKEEEEPPVLTDEEKRTFELLSEMSPRSLGAVLVWPDQWKATLEYLAPMLRALPIPEPIEARLLGASTPRELVALMLGVQEPPLAHWDLSKPMMVAFMESDARFSSGFSLVEMALGGERVDLPGMHHRALVPATDATKLAAEFGSLFSMMGMESLQAGAFRGKAPGASIYRGATVVVAVIPEPDRVRLEMLTGWVSKRASSTAPSGGSGGGGLGHVGEAVAAGSAAGEGSRGADLPDLSVLFEREGSTLRLTPAVRHVVSTGKLASMLLRTGLVRDTAAQATLAVIRGALENAAPEYVVPLLARGVGELLTGYLLLAPGLARHGDVGVGVDLQDGVHLLAVAEVTAEGRKFYDKGRTAPFNRLVQVESGWAMKLVLNLDFGAMLKAGERSPLMRSLADAKSRSQWRTKVGELRQECGLFCYLFATVGGLALGGEPLVQPASRGSEGMETLPLPQSMAAVVLPPADGQEEMRAAAAARFASGTSADSVKAALLEVADALVKQNEVQVEGTDEGVWGLVSSGLAAGTVFQAEEKAKADGFMALLSIRPYLCTWMVKAADNVLVPLFLAAEDLVAAARYGGEVVVLEARLRCRSADGKPLPEIPLPATFQLPAESVDAGAYAYSEEARCTDTAMTAIREYLLAISAADPEWLARLTAEAAKNLAEVAVGCGPLPPGTKTGFEMLQSLLPEYVKKMPGYRAIP